MTRISGDERTRRQFLSAALATAVTAGSVRPAFALSEPLAPRPVIDWIRTHAAPVGSVDRPPGPAEARAIDQLVEGARVIALGEPSHGAHEPLAYRNRLIQYLVRGRGLTAVALESGLAGTSRVAAYVAGGPGSAEEVVRDNLSWGFNNYRSNVELVAWLREWNADPRHQKVRFYGTDLSGGDEKSGFGKAGIVLADVIDFLARTVPSASAGERKAAEAFRGRFSAESYRTYSLAARRELDATLAAIDRLFVTRREAMIAASTPDAYDFARRELWDSLRLVEVFREWPEDPSKPSAAALRVSAIRDRVMANHVLWALSREGPQGRILLFQSNGHVTAGAFGYRLLGEAARGLATSGHHLRAALGNKYRIIVTSARVGQAGDPARRGSIEKAMAAARRAPMLLDIRSAAPARWWNGRQSFTNYTDRIIDTVPAKAFDGVLLLDRLTPEPMLPARQ